jgi:DnaJ family protein C protein 27
MVERGARPLQVPPPKDPFRYKLVVVGEPTTGKTAIVRRWAEDSFNTKYDATIGVDFFAKNVSGIVLNVWDMSGHPEFFEVRNEFYKDCQGLCLVYDVTQRRTFDALDMWLREGSKYGADKASLYTAVVGNKLDMGSRRVVSRQEAEAWCESRQFDYFEMSASSGQNVNTLFESIAAKAKLAP